LLRGRRDQKSSKPTPSNPGHIRASSKPVAIHNAVISAREAVAKASSQDRQRQFQELTKNLLLDPSRRIELDDVVNEEARGVLTELSNTERFPVTGSTGNNADLLVEIVGQAQHAWEVVEPLCWSTHIAARYADSDALTPWVSAMRSITAFGEKPESGLTPLIHLRRLPALCLTETVAIAAVSSGRWENLRALLVAPRIGTYSRDEKLSLADIVAPYRPFEANKMIAQVLASVTKDPSLDAKSALASCTEGKRGKLYTPVSDWMFEVLKPAFERQFSDEDEYADAFDRAECFLGALQQHEKIMFAKKYDRFLGRASWYGRSTWRFRGSRSPLDDILDEARADAEAWPAVRNNLFDGDPDSAVTAIETYKASYDQLRGRRI
ncbi:hypothetical protein, partial [Gordonia sputi]|uniref:hypothetical protein n=1 Tax=Gordonia sputi TaxID=36823 RepID=UPI0028A76337